MQVTMTVQEVLTALDALMGMLSGAQNAQAKPQKLAYIDQAYRATLQKMRWVTTQRIHRPTLSIDQIVLNYPPDAYAGSVYRISRWDADQKLHIPLERRQLTAEDDWEPLNAAGGTPDEAARDHPMYWADHAGQLRFSPPAKEAVQLMIEYTLNAPLPNTSTVIPIDGEAVKLHAYAQMLLSDGLREQASFQLDNWKERIKALRVWQHTGEVAVWGEVIEDGPRAYRELPNWDRRPS